MNKAFIFIAGLVAGASVGALASQQYFKKKYTDEANGAIESVKETFKEERDSLKEEIDTLKAKFERDEQNRLSEALGTENVEVKFCEEDVEEYKQVVKGTNYASYSETKDDDKDDDEIKGPVVIQEEEFGLIEDYDIVTLWWYKDDVAADGDDEIYEYFMDEVGEEAIKHFDDSNTVYVQNDQEEKYYEVYKVEDTYENVINGSNNEEKYW